MERECWAELSAAISQVKAQWKESARVEHATALIVRVHLWSALHDRPTCWACDADHWTAHARPPRLPDQSTLSRRMRGKWQKSFDAFCDAMARRLSGGGRPGAALGLALRLLKRMDGKPLPVAAHSKDPDARWGRGAGQDSKGYKLHVIRSENAVMPEQWAVTPLDVDERVVARRMIKRLSGAGYLLCDTMYDSSHLHDGAAAVNHQLLAPRRKPNTGLGHCYQSPHRLRCIDLLEPPGGVSDFGTRLYERRRDIETRFGNLTSFGGGLCGLPPWVRRIWRVRAWVRAKLLIDAARSRYRKRVSHA